MNIIKHPDWILFWGNPWSSIVYVHVHVCSCSVEQLYAMDMSPLGLHEVLRGVFSLGLPLFVGTNFSGFRKQCL